MGRIRLLLVDDDEVFRRLLTSSLRELGYDVVPAGSVEEARFRILDSVLDLALVDLRLSDGDGLDVLRAIREHQPRVETVMLTGHGTISTSVQAMRQGAFDYLRKPCPTEELEVTLQKAREHQMLVAQNAALRRGLIPSGARRTAGMVGESPAFRELLDLVGRIAPADSTVLIHGETGTGKEEVAKLLHAMSPRSGNPLVTVDCTSLQPELLSNELFGHERGSYTGAERAKPGLFEVADQGTLFLDEIGEVPPEIQTRLLRVLEGGTFRRVGATREIRVDVRIVAATNRELTKMMSEGQFRRDLYYRLSTIGIHVPPLRSRLEDVPLLVECFLDRLEWKLGRARRFTPAAMTALRKYAWPGNVRELMHVVERAVVLARNTEIGVEALPRELLNPALSDPELPEELATCAEIERRHILRVIESVRGSRTRACAILGIGERTLYRKLKEYGYGQE